MFKANAHNTQAYFPTCANACAQHSHVDGGGERSKAIFKNLQKIEAWAQIVCSSNNVS